MNVTYLHKDRYSIKIQDNNDQYDDMIDKIEKKKELVEILSCVNHWPEFKIMVEKDKSAFDRPDVAFMLFQQRMEAMKLYNKKKDKHSDRWRDLIQDDDEEKSDDDEDKSNIVDNKDTNKKNMFYRVSQPSTKIC